MKGTWIKAGLVLGLGLAVVAPAVASAASPAAVTQSAAQGAHGRGVAAVAKALGITPQQARTAIREGAVKELARVSHMTPRQVRAKLKGIGLAKANAGHRIGRRGVAVGLKAVASQLQMSPASLRQAIRQRNLTLPAGTSVQALQGTAQTAVQSWLQGLAKNHPKLTTQRQQAITQRVVSVIGKLLTRATTPTPTGTTPATPSQGA